MDVILKNGTVFKFKECWSGLYYYYIAITYDHNSAKNNLTIIPYSLLLTVLDTKKSYTRAEIEGEDRAKRYQGLLGCPATSAFNTYANNNFLLKCNITVV